MRIVGLSAAMLASAKRSFATRRVPIHHMKTLIEGAVRPAAGDMVLARVEQLGQQARIELPDGRRARMFPGDHIIACFGNRYAPDQCEAVIGPDLSPCHLVAAGGIAATELCRHDRMRPATRIAPLGLVGDAHGFRVNVFNYGIKAPEHAPSIPVILSLGTSMNAGETMTAASVMRGLRVAGLKVASLKITGTGAGDDSWMARDAGADLVLDVTDAGFASTYLAPVDAIIRGTYRLLNHAAERGCDVAVIQIADGLQQKENAALLRSPALRDLVLGVVLSAPDSIGSKCGVGELTAAGFTPLGLSGRLGHSPLAVREAEEATGLKVYSPLDLQAGALVPVIALAASHRPAAQPSSATMQTLAGLRVPARRPAAPDPVPLCAAPMPDLRPEILRLIAEEAMLADIDRLCAVSAGERGGRRADTRNGYRVARRSSAIGSLSLRIPRVRAGRYRPDLSRVMAVDEEYLDTALRLAWSREELGQHLAQIGVHLTEFRLATLSHHLKALVAGGGRSPAQPVIEVWRGSAGASPPSPLYAAAPPLPAPPGVPDDPIAEPSGRFGYAQ